MPTQDTIKVVFIRDSTCLGGQPSSGIEPVLMKIL